MLQFRGILERELQQNMFWDDNLASLQYRT